ncbi:methylamine utilization protein [Massilia sp. CCM 8734]|nr:methylamine utilization protein [Massilia sp. CCM 8734]
MAAVSLAALPLASAAGAAAIAVQVHDSSGKPLADVVVTAAPDGNAGLPQPVKPAEIEQRGLKFLPLVTVIQTGSQVSFPNFDKVKHHIYSFSPAKKFDQKLYSGVAASPQVFDKAGIVVLGCNIHDRMLAYIKVVDTPFFAKTDAAGVARIELPAAGKYTLTSWHFNMLGAPAEQSVAVKGEGATAASVKLALKPMAPDVAAPGAGAP